MTLVLIVAYVYILTTSFLSILAWFSYHPLPKYFFTFHKPSFIFVYPCLLFFSSGRRRVRSRNSIQGKEHNLRYFFLYWFFRIRNTFGPRFRIYICHMGLNRDTDSFYVKNKVFLKIHFILTTRFANSSGLVRPWFLFRKNW